MPQYIEQLQVYELEWLFKEFIIKHYPEIGKNKLNDWWKEFLRDLKTECSIVDRM